MPNGIDSFASVEPQLLVASFATAGHAVACNPAWTTVFGPVEPAWGRLAPEDQGMADRALREAVGGSLVTNQIFPVFIPDRDQPLPVLLNFLPVHTEDDGETRISAVTVTGEVLAEPTSWTASQTERHRMETLGRMAMGIAHDFNNLLTSILGHIELMKAEAQTPPPDLSFREHLRTVEQAALDGAGVVRKIQQYIRQEKATHFETVRLETLVQDCVSLTRPYWYNEPRRQGISIHVRLDLADVPPVSGSATELREVFINLILNAVQAMPRGGTITFTTAFDKGHGVVLQMRDTGTGMSDAVRARIFEPLFTTKGEHGTGMGLAVTYGIIQEHDGTITVDSKLGAGTTFTITLPPAGEPEPEDAAEAAPLTTQAARILIVDDERMVRSVLAKLLGLGGHHVDQVASGPEALARVENETYDLVFTDHGMPEMNGRELARTLRQRYPDLPIILLTGDTEVGKADESVNVVMAKPFHYPEMEATIQQLLRKRSSGDGPDEVEDGTPA